MRGVTVVSVGVVVLCVAISHVQTAVHLSPDDHVQQILMVIGPTEHRNQSLMHTVGSKRRQKRQADLHKDYTVDENKRGFTVKEKKDILDLHNKFRGEESAADMMFMSWDNTLEQMAQVWSDQCNMVHSPSGSRGNVGDYFRVGENLYAGPVKYNAKQFVTAWQSEKPAYNYFTKGCYTVCGHYTQVVWATSYAIGCGVRYCPKLKNGRIVPRGYFITCNYGPSGNLAGARPYQAGKPCAKCGKDRPFCVQNMCAKSEVPESGIIETEVMSGVQKACIGIEHIIMSAILSLTLVTSILTPSRLL